MTPQVAWTQPVEAPRREGRSPAQRLLLEDAARYRQDAARCAMLAARAIEVPVRSQLAIVAETYRRLARQLEALARLS